MCEEFSALCHSAILYMWFGDIAEREVPKSGLLLHGYGCQVHAEVYLLSDLTHL